MQIFTISYNHRIYQISNEPTIHYLRGLDTLGCIHGRPTDPDGFRRNYGFCGARGYACLDQLTPLYASYDNQLKLDIWNFQLTIARNRLTSSAFALQGCEGYIKWTMYHEEMMRV